MGTSPIPELFLLKQNNASIDEAVMLLKGRNYGATECFFLVRIVYAGQGMELAARVIDIYGLDKDTTFENPFTNDFFDALNKDEGGWEE